MATGKKVKPKTAAGPKKKKPATSPVPEAAKAPAPRASENTNGLSNPGEDRYAEFLRLTTREMAFDLLQHPEEWLEWPNPKLGGQKPNDLIANGQEERVRTLLICASMGIFT